MTRRPNWRTTFWPTTAGRSTLVVLRGRVGTQPIHHGRSFREQEQHDHQEKAAQRSGYAGQDRAESAGEGTRYDHEAHGGRESAPHRNKRG
jgi:hypothetical protein